MTVDRFENYDRTELEDHAAWMEGLLADYSAARTNLIIQREVHKADAATITAALVRKEKVEYRLIAAAMLIANEVENLNA